jgi:ATP-dependent Lon protease
MGGELLTTEATVMPGKGKLIITGKLGEVMQESAQAAMSYVRSRADRFGIDRRFAETCDIHIHLPEGAIPKDGPSAGVTMATALVSALAKIPVRRDVAMTGEITLRGRVLPIGGLKEKTLAAHRAGMKTVLIPRENRKDLRDIPKKIRDQLRIVAVEYVDDVLREALLLEKPEEFFRKPSPEPEQVTSGRRRPPEAGGPPAWPLPGGRRPVFPRPSGAARSNNVAFTGGMSAPRPLSGAGGGSYLRQSGGGSSRHP